MIWKPLDSGDLPAFADAWAGIYGERFRISAADIQRQALDHPLFMAEASGGNGHAWIALKRPPQGRLFIGDRSDRVHITAWAGSSWEAMNEVLQQALVRAQCGDAVFGQDHDHIWPGAPQHLWPKFDGWSLSGDAHDVERNLEGYEPYEGCLAPLTGDTLVRQARSEDSRALEAFLAEEFPGRWHYDGMRKLRSEPEELDLLFRGEECIGFSITQSPSTAHPVSGAMWRHSLGENWRTLGPIGVSAKVRGQGLGHALLGASLQRLAQSGGKRCLIDWTTLVDFYGRHGFESARKYRTAILSTP